MNIHSNKSSWKIILAAFGFVILLVTLYYSNYLARQLEEKEAREAKIFRLASVELARMMNDSKDLNENIPLIDAIVLDEDGENKIPVITEAENGDLEGSYWDGDKNNDQEFLRKKVEEFLAEGKVPLEGYAYASKIYFFNSPLLTKIKLFPLAQIGLVGLFIALGYFLFSSARSSEQNRIWAGMAKETAHQLGTPISAIIGWIENLKLIAEDQPEQVEIVEELRKDVQRLELIADRFSKIGSTPELEKVNIYKELEVCKDYMMRRSPKRVSFHFPDQDSAAEYVMINKHLFDWVIENLIRNALDAMEREGRISASVYTESNFVCIDLSDTGKGMTSAVQKQVFDPGFSTKQRGWGLGLSLSKRIIKDYHKGKIFVKQSKMNEGTIFTIKLPSA